MRRGLRWALAVVAIAIGCTGGTIAWLRSTTAPPCATSETVTSHGDGNWVAVGAMPSGRSEIYAAALDEFVYVAGGIGLGTLDTFERYDTTTDRWETLPPLPQARHHVALAAVQGAVYAAGGFSDLSFTPSRDAWRFDVAAKRWIAIAPMTSPRGEHTLHAVNGKLYAVGGSGDDAHRVTEYDPEADTWRRVGEPLPTARTSHAGVVWGGRIFVLGGRDPDLGNLALVEVFDPANHEWEVMPPMPQPRAGFGAAALDDGIHVLGGEDFFRDPSCIDGSHLRFDPVRGSWTQLPPMPTARHGITTVVVGKQLFAIGGATHPGTRTVATFSDLVERFE